jgi:type VII secretion protein EccB
MIPNAGEPPQFLPPFPAPVGAVVTAYAPDSTSLYYVVLADGLQPIGPVLATMLRNTNSYGIDQPPRINADEVARMPVSMAIDTSVYPNEQITIVDSATAPVTCAHWVIRQAAGTDSSALTLLSGPSLPLRDSSRTVELVSGGSGGVAHRVAMSPGSGYFVTTTGGQFWIADTGVRYGIDTDDPSVDTATAIGLTAPPIPIPPAILPLFAAGPTLSRSDALLAYDGLSPGPQPLRRIRETP